MWFGESTDIAPTEVSYIRTTILDAGDGTTYTDVEKGEKMMDGSFVAINLQFKKKAK
jgi:hypothetical protein